MKSLLAYLFVYFLMQVGATAQCAFNPEITPASPSLCPFQSDTLFTGAADSWQWYRNGTPVNNNNLPYLVVSNPADNGATILVVQTINGCSEASPAVTVSGIALPTFLIGVDGSSNLSACLGDTVTLHITSGQSSGIQWFRNGTQLSGQNGTSIQVVQTGNYSATGAIAECPTSTQFSNTLSITFVASSQPQVFEDVQEGTLNSSIQTGGFQWYLNGNALEGATSSSITPTDTGAYSVAVQFAAGCTRLSDPYNFDGFEVVCDHLPTISPSALVLCPGGIDTLFTQTYDSYQWFIDGTAVSSATSGFLVINDTLAGAEITVAATLAGCTANSEPLIPLIHVFSSPEILSPANPIAVCEGNTLNVSLPDGFIQPISWALDGIPIPGANASQLSISQAGVYTVTASTEVCPNISLTSGDLTVTLNSNPVPTLGVQGSSIQCTTTGVNYTWSLNGEVVQGLNSQTILAQIGIWQVSVTYANGCVNTSEPLVVETIGFNEVTDGMVLLGPNPCEDRIHVKARQGRMSVYSAEGRLVFQEEIPAGVISLDTSNWMQGLYLFRWEQKGEAGSFLVLKH